jgi:uncharacterized protein (TIGR02246 family)
MFDRRCCCLVWSLGTLLGCARTPAAPPTTVSSASARTAIDSQMTKLLDAYRRRDGEAFAEIYATDAMMHSSEGALAGRPAIEDVFTKGLASVISVVNDTATTEEFMASGDRAVQTGHIVWTETDKGKKPVKTRLDFALTWRKDPDGAWRIARDLNAETHP